MDVEYSPEQEMLRESARALLAARWSAADARAALDHPPAVIPDALWREIVALGWPALTAGDDMGGADIVTAAILAEEAGRALLPGPLRSSLAAAAVFAQCGIEAHRAGLLADLAEGRARITVALDEPGAPTGTDGIGVAATRTGDGWRLDGTKHLVPDAETADVLLVVARAAEGIGVWTVPRVAPGVVLGRQRRLDGQSVAEVALDGVVVDADSALGDPGPDTQAWLERALDTWCTLVAADLLGVASRALEVTAEYAGERVQYGRPIGTFQAVSHRLADVCLEVEIARSLVLGACLALDGDRPDAKVLVSAAKAWAGDTAVAAGEAAVLLHGGIGFTWEHDAHLFLRRARADAVTLGTADWHRDRIADHLDRALAPES